MGNESLIFFHCMTPLHNGAGQGLGAIDRPVIRESTTGYPFIQGSSIKGVLRWEAEDVKGATDKTVTAAFGVGETTGYQGCVVLTDASLLLLPVRSLVGTFVWATSRLALARFARFLDVAGDPSELRRAVGAVLGASKGIPRGTALGPEGWGETDTVNAGQKPPAWDADVRLNGNGPYCIEQLVLEAVSGGAGENVGELAVRLGAVLFPDGKGDAEFWRDFFKHRVLILNDDDFGELAGRATQVEANIKIEQNGVTKDGSLRYTEYLPTETVLVSLLEVGEPRNGIARSDVETLVDEVLSGPLQVGADESTGKGLVRVVRHDPGIAGEEDGHGQP